MTAGMMDTDIQMHAEETRNSLLMGIIYRAKHCSVPVQTTIGISLVTVR